MAHSPSEVLTILIQSREGREGRGERNDPSLPRYVRSYSFPGLGIFLLPQQQQVVLQQQQLAAPANALRMAVPSHFSWSWTRIALHLPSMEQFSPTEGRNSGEKTSRGSSCPWTSWMVNRVN